MNPLKGLTVTVAILATLALTPVSASAANWYTGTIDAGSSKTFHWNNANPLNTSYVVGLDPVGATAGNPCQMEVTRNWYQQKPGGEREFWFIIKNVGTFDCGANILLRQLSVTNGAWHTNALNPGQSVTTHWNNAYLGAYAVGLSPQGATSTTACQFEITRSWNVMRVGPTGPTEREIWFTYKNVGTIACSTDIQMGYKAVDEPLYHPSMEIGASQSWVWNNALPLTRAYVLDVLPGFTTQGNSCDMEITRSYYVQKINTDGSTEREFHYTEKNVGNLKCPGNILLGAADA